MEKASGESTVISIQPLLMPVMVRFSRNWLKSSKSTKTQRTEKLLSSKIRRRNYQLQTMNSES